MARERDRLVRQTLHETAVAGDHIGTMIDEARAEARREEPLGERHAHRVGETLRERPGRRFDARGVAALGMARRAAAELAEMLELGPRHVVEAGQVQKRIEQHRSVAGRQNESVAIGPLGMRGIEFKEFAPQHGRDIRHAHRHAGMPALRLFHGVHGERPNRVGHAAQSAIVRLRQGRSGMAGRLGDAHRRIAAGFLPSHLARAGPAPSSCEDAARSLMSRRRSAGGA